MLTEEVDYERIGQIKTDLRNMLEKDFEVVDSDADNIHGGEYAQTHTAGRDDAMVASNIRAQERRDSEAIVEQVPEAIDSEIEVEEVNRINRENGLTNDGDEDIEDIPLPLTLEEQVIQWAAQQGGALNIIERNNHG